MKGLWTVWTPEKTMETYARALKQFFKFLSANNISRPDRKDIVCFKDRMKATHKPTTVQNYIVVVKLFFSRAEQEGLYKNIASKIKGPKLSKEHKKDYLTSNQVKAVLSGVGANTLKDLRNYAVLSLMVTGGLRTVEVSRADAEGIKIVGSNTVLYIRGKGREEKTDYIKIQPMVETAVRNYLKASGKKLGLKEPLFSSISNNGKGERLSVRSVGGIVKSRLIKAGFNSERLTAHSLRHTAITPTLLGGQTLQEAQRFARHTNIATTQIYAHNLDRAENKCEEVIAKAIF